MNHIKSIIKRRFRSEYFPEDIFFDANKVCVKTKNIELLDGEEVIVTIDNEPGTEIVDCCMLTDKRIIFVKGNEVHSVNYDDIKHIELPHIKIDSNKHYEDLRMNITDKTNIHLINGDIQEIRIIYGGIYQLGNFSRRWWQSKFDDEAK